MATPHVAAAAVILAQAHPDWRGDAIKDALVSSAKGLGLRYFEQGAGRVDVPRTLGHGVYGSAAIDFGAGRVTEFALSYSTDNGTGWTTAATRRIADGRYRVHVNHPGTGTEVWLRVQAADDAGDRVDQTVRHAYWLR